MTRVALLLPCVDTPPYMHDTPRASARRAGELPARELANIVHGFASMRHHPGNALLVACAAQAAERIAEAYPQGLANTLWGFAKLQYNPGVALLRACEAAAARRAEEFKPQEVVLSSNQSTRLYKLSQGAEPISLSNLSTYRQLPCVVDGTSLSRKST